MNYELRIVGGVRSEERRAGEKIKEIAGDYY